MYVRSVVVVMEVFINIEGIATGSLITGELEVSATTDSELPARIVYAISSADGTTTSVMDSSLFSFSTIFMYNVLSSIRLQ